MPVNEWLGVAIAKVAVRAFKITGAQPGAVYTLRDGARNVSYTVPANSQGKAQAELNHLVATSIVEATTGSGLAGGAGLSASTVLSVEFILGDWHIVATGPSNGAPVDVEMDADDPQSSAIVVTELQAGQAATNQTQRVKVPAGASAGNLNVRYMGSETTVVYNVAAAALKAAIEGLADFPGTVTVTGSFAEGYEIEVLGGIQAEEIIVDSDDLAGAVGYSIEISQRGGAGRQSFQMSGLDGIGDSVFRFVYGDEQSYLFSGASTVDQLRAALESIVGAGNVSIGRAANGIDYKIALAGDRVGLAGTDLSVVDQSTGITQALPATAAELTLGKTIQAITLTGMPKFGVGTFTLRYDGSTTAAIPFSSATTAATITAALSAAGIDWTCSSVEGGVAAAYVITLATTTDVAAPAGAVVPSVASLVGSAAIEFGITGHRKAARNAVQQVHIWADPTGGTYTLTFGGDTTAGIAPTASGADVLSALEALPSIGAGGVEVIGVSDGPYVITFVGALASAPQALLVGNPAGLTLTNTATVSQSEVTVPTGPNWYSNFGNWSLLRVPIAGDTAEFRKGSVPCLYGFDGVATPAAFDVYRSYGGAIGLPPERDEGLPETLNRALRFSGTTGSLPVRIGLGDDGDGPALVVLDLDAQPGTIAVLYASGASGTGAFSVEVAGTEITQADVMAGTVGIGVGGLAAAVDEMLVSSETGSNGGTIFVAGEGCAIANFRQIAGSSRLWQVPESVTSQGGELIVRGSGDVDSIALVDTTLFYHASGGLGLQGAISSVDQGVGDIATVTTSAAHGRTTGDSVWVQGVTGQPEMVAGAHYVITVTGASTFTLDGTTVSGGAQAQASATWGLSEAIRLTNSKLDFSSLRAARVLGAPIVVDASSTVLDPLETVTPSLLTES